MDKKKRIIDRRMLRRLMPYVGRYVWLIAAAVTALLIADLSSILRPYMVKQAIDVHITTGDFDGLKQIVILLGAIITGGFLFQVVFHYAIQFLGQRLIYELRIDLFKKVLSLSKAYFDKTPVGKTLTNVTNDVESIRQFISDGIVNAVGSLLKVLLIFIAMMLINYRLALLAFTTIPLFVGATLFFRTRIRSGYQQVRKANADINVSLVETINGIQEIHQFTFEEESRKQFDASNVKYRTAFLSVVHAYSLFFPLIEIISNLGMIIVLVYAHFGLGITVQIGEVFAFFTYINMFFGPLRELAEKYNMFQSAMAASERIFRLLDEPITVREPQHPVQISGPVRGDITFTNVSFGYQPDTPVIKNLSFQMVKGEKIAIVGATGSGKTTIINLLNRMYDVQSGKIAIDNMDIRSLRLEDLRNLVATVPQETFLFTGTVAENISVYQPIPREDIENAAQQVRADHFIRHLPAQYDENVLEEGKRLSVGQKQLLGFARAFVRDPAIVVLDEATANVDSETEHLIEDGIQNLLRNRSAIIIAHRLSTIKSVDRILVLHNGELVEEGSHDELIRLDGIYRQLYKMQALSHRTSAVTAAGI